MFCTHVRGNEHAFSPTLNASLVFSIIGYRHPVHVLGMPTSTTHKFKTGHSTVDVCHRSLDFRYGKTPVHPALDQMIKTISQFWLLKRTNRLLSLLQFDSPLSRHIFTRPVSGLAVAHIPSAMAQHHFWPSSVPQPDCGYSDVYECNCWPHFRTACSRRTRLVQIKAKRKEVGTTRAAHLDERCKACKRIHLSKTTHQWR
jgi:hypothetical protein